MLVHPYPRKYSVRPLLRIQEAARWGAMSNVYWIPGAGNPPDGHPQHKCDMAPFLPVMRNGSLFPALFAS